MGFRCLVCIPMILCTTVLGAKDVSDEVLVSKAMGASLQGDASTALRFLDTVKPSKISAKSESFYTCMFERFKSDEPARNDRANDGSFTFQLTKLFRRYWHRSLKSPHSREKYAKALDNELKSVLKLDNDAPPTDLDNAIRSRLKKEGNYALLGQTGALRELMIWSKEERREESVEMPHGSYTTSVVYLDEFVEPGWGQYATCEQRGAGGWVADRTLFAVVPLYDDIESEEFKVTFLGHETQHFLDLDSYADIQSWELEYRAKLIELSMADKTLPNVVQKFIEDQREDPTYPHSYANYRVLSGLVSKLSLATPADLYNTNHESVNQAAVSLFNADTASRE